MKNSSKISVIIPAYNVGDYISNTINSVLNQTYNKKNIELIIVNDGSTDHTLEQIEKYSKLPQVIIVNVRNGGVSKARNIGIEQASGDFISFLDGDDTWKPEFLKEMVSFAKDNNLKTVSCLFNRIEAKVVSYEIDTVPTKNELFKWYIGRQGMTINTNSWLISSEVIKDNNLLFVEGSHFGEDTEFFLKVILNSEKEKWSVLEKRLTNYHIRQGSLTNPNGRMKLERIEMYFDAFRRTFQYMRNYEITQDELKAFKDRIYLYYTVYLSSILINGTKTDYKKLKKYFSQDKKELKMNTLKNMSSKQLLRFILIKLDFVFLRLKFFKIINSTFIARKYLK